MSSDDLNDEFEALDRAPVARRRLRFGWLIPAVGMAASAFLLARSKDDLTYLLQSSAPVDLGQPGDAHFERARPGVYAKIRGKVQSEGAIYHRGQFSSGKLWPLTTAPLSIERSDFTEQRGMVSVDGELHSEDELPAYRTAIHAFLSRDQLAPPGAEYRTSHEWILVEGRRPRAFDLSNGWLALLALMFGLNTYWLVLPVLRGG